MFSVAASPFHLIKQNSQMKKAHSGYQSVGEGSGPSLTPVQLWDCTQLGRLKFTNSDTVHPPPCQGPQGPGKNTSDDSPEQLETRIRTCYLHHSPHTLFYYRKRTRKEYL